MIPKKLSMKNRRGVSNIIGSLIVLAIVASVGSVILFQGLNQINTFNHDLSFYDKAKNAKLQENLIFEHVRFDNSTLSDVEIYLANIGTVDATVSTVLMIHIESQELILDWETTNSTGAAFAPIQLDQNQKLTFTAILDCPVVSPVPSLPDCLSPEWDDPYYRDSEYRISITTSRGNFVPTIASPWNT